MIVSVPEFGEDPAKRIEIVQPGAESGAGKILLLLGPHFCRSPKWRTNLD